MTEPLPLSENQVVLAAELVLELLDGNALAAALALEQSNPQVRAEVARWRAYSQRWMNTDRAEALRALVWSRIAASLPREAVGDAAAPASAAPERTKIARFWRPLALAASLACVVAIGVNIVSLNRHASQQREAERLRQAIAQVAAPNVAQISGANGAALMSAAYYPDRGLLQLRLADLGTERTAPELWVLDKAGKPHSLGLVAGPDDLTVKLSGELRQLLTDGATVAITLEPRANAPHAEPSGAILGTARLSRL